jgi:hypothetical protein
VFVPLTIKKMVYTIIEAHVIAAVGKNLEKNPELLIGKKAAIRKKLYATYADLEVYTLLR